MKKATWKRTNLICDQWPETARNCFRRSLGWRVAKDFQAIYVWAVEQAPQGRGIITSLIWSQEAFEQSCQAHYVIIGLFCEGPKVALKDLDRSLPIQHILVYVPNRQMPEEYKHAYNVNEMVKINIKAHEGKKQA